MFEKILIANRGEIACRIIKTAKRLGIRTVAVYSEADTDALHCRMADEVVAIGPSASAESYLVIDRLVEACRRTGAQAVHPGYGFLSENPRFQKALADAGIAFIGPDADAIAAMGDKIESKRLAQDAGVSSVPGHLEPLADENEAAEVAGSIGYPVMLKASAGGGGKGMRIAFNEQEARDGFRSAANEARASFGDDRVFVEKYIVEPRHIEIQVLADRHGNAVYLGERECSIQRRHQKVIEEAPSPVVTPETRRAMGEQAVALAKAVNYSSAGTVEFIVDRDTNFYFLEMNTRLQVEHPVTEFVTGLDLVELMIRIAAGDPLPFTQDEVRLQGWAIEARVYAEDPVRGFLPSIGRLVRYEPPAETATVRVDTGIYEGGEITMFYDPMAAKVITYGQDRDQAITAMGHALDSFYIRGIRHNISFLAALMNHPRFREGRLTTNFIAEEFPDGFSGATLTEDALMRVISVAAALHRQTIDRNRRISGQVPGYKPRPPSDLVVRIDRANYPVAVQPVPSGFEVHVNGKAHAVISHWEVGDRLFDGIVDGHRMVVQVDPVGAAYRLYHGGAELEILVLTPQAATFADIMPVKTPPDLSKYLISPMPGLLSSVAVSAGDTVQAGQELVVIEAMKMENILRAERDGVISTLHAQPGDSLSVDQKILEFE